MIVDSSVILSAFFPDEAQPQAQQLIRDHVAGRAHLVAPSLLSYELSNAVWLAERRGRIDSSQADQIMQIIDGLEIETRAVDWAAILSFARQFGCTAYDAAYLALASISQQRLITGDQRLYNAVHDRLDWVLWIGNYANQD